MEILTKTEEKVMQILWRIKKGFVKDIIEQLPSPKPPYNTISSVVRILEQKGFASHKAYGKTHEYYPIIAKAAYKKFAFKKMMMNYFDNSLDQYQIISSTGNIHTGISISFSIIDFDRFVTPQLNEYLSCLFS